MLKGILALLFGKKQLDLDLIMINRSTDLRQIDEINPPNQMEFKEKAEFWIKKDPIVAFERFMLIIIISNISPEKKEILQKLIKKIIKENDELFFIKYKSQCDIVYCNIYEKIKQKKLSPKEKKNLSEAISLLKDKIKENKEIKKNLEEINFLLSE